MSDLGKIQSTLVILEQGLRNEYEKRRERLLCRGVMLAVVWVVYMVVVRERRQGQVCRGCTLVMNGCCEI